MKNKNQKKNKKFLKNKFLIILFVYINYLCIFAPVLGYTSTKLYKVIVYQRYIVGGCLSKPI